MSHKGDTFFVDPRPAKVQMPHVSQRKALARSCVRVNMSHKGDAFFVDTKLVQHL